MAAVRREQLAQRRRIIEDAEIAQRVERYRKVHELGIALFD